MFTIHCSRPACSAVVAVLTFALWAPITVNADEQVIAEELVLAAEDQDPALAPIAGPSWDEVSGYGSVERTRIDVSALLSGEVIGGQDQSLAQAAAAAAALWDATSGYGSVEASRGANALPAAPTAFASQVPSDVRWAPDRTLEHAMNPLLAVAMAWDETSGYGSVEASRAEMSALLSGAVISGRDQALAFAAASAKVWDVTSGYGSVEASRAAASTLLPLVGAPATGADSIPAALASGQRAESAHLATVPLPGEDTADGALAIC
jgi:hypothetical protein